ncbi:hypothetical protein [Streptomyces indicus]|uniref:Secreted protein n=1 Tax=Streptomyces indicus TaxID=417292 RepID=A0A1G9DDE3_9ACTN|nr:hypothetical protein [Streptomyces indicus]SDK61912.1 hypothetical protein SAMN05421806_109163 [Streptomyces indicus]
MNKNVVVRGAGIVAAALMILGGTASAASAAAPKPEENLSATADAAVGALVRLDLAGLIDAVIPDLEFDASVNADAEVDAEVGAEAAAKTGAKTKTAKEAIANSSTAASFSIN